MSVLLIGHGSPDRRAHDNLGELQRLVADRLGCPVDLGVLEFASDGLPRLSDAFGRFAAGTRVAAQPLLLFEGLHGQEDMPREAAAAARALSLDVRLGRAFGEDPALVAAALRHVLAAQAREGDVLLFVGRGSSFEFALEQAARVARCIGEAAGVPHVLCHAGISRPDSGEGMRLAGARARRVLVLPWLIHSGVLLDRVRERTSAVAAEAGVEAVQLPHIGNSPELVEVVAARIGELLRA